MPNLLEFDFDKEIDPTKQELYCVRFTVQPKHELVSTTGVFDQESDLAFAEAEFLARTLESEFCNKDLNDLIRALLFGSCMNFAKALETYQTNPQFVRDVYPYGRIFNKDLREHFESFVVSLSQEAPELFQQFFGGQQNAEK